MDLHHGRIHRPTVCGLIVGLIVVGVVLLIGRMLGKRPTFAEGGESPARARA